MSKMQGPKDLKASKGVSICWQADKPKRPGGSDGHPAPARSRRTAGGTPSLLLPRLRRLRSPLRQPVDQPVELLLGVRSRGRAGVQCCVRAYVGACPSASHGKRATIGTAGLLRLLRLPSSPPSSYTASRGSAPSAGGVRSAPGSSPRPQSDPTSQPGRRVTGRPVPAGP